MSDNVIMYGRGAQAIADQIGSTKEEAQDIIDDFYTSFPKVKEWTRLTEDTAMKTGKVEDWYGRVRHLPILLEDDYSFTLEDKDTFNPILFCKDKQINPNLLNKYKSDINMNNPLGYKGQLCRIYANFLKNIWYGSKTVYTPKNFKDVLGNLNESFAGAVEQDAHEFLGFLIDGLHEDLNRCLIKQYKETDGENQIDKKDSIKSMDNWIQYLSRNQSILIDLFYGQFQYTTFCPNNKCQNIFVSEQ